jgi:DNA-binding SARP family transcriptional activator
MMIALRTLGTLDLRASDGHDVKPLLRQPKRCALLVYLALAGPERFRRRDTVVALFWPELDDTHARGALRQALRFVRRTLGDGVVATRGEEEIRLEPQAVTVDAQTFERSCETGRNADAIGLYGGDFLDGFHLSDASPAFEHWVDEQRARLRGLAVRAAWALADARRSDGDISGALDMARRAAGFSPDSEAAVAREIAFLDESGDRAGALAAYTKLERRLAAEFDAEPAPETRALIHEIRTRTRTTSTPTPGRPASAPNATATVASNPPSPAPGTRRRPALLLIA